DRLGGAATAQHAARWVQPAGDHPVLERFERRQRPGDGPERQVVPLPGPRQPRRAVGVGARGWGIAGRSALIPRPLLPIVHIAPSAISDGEGEIVPRGCGAEGHSTTTTAASPSPCL